MPYTPGQAPRGETLPQHHYDPYPTLAPFYDVMARALLLPFGGERRVRRAALGDLGIGRGTTVTELGCGTGSNTRLMVELGAQVTAVDLSEPMLARARAKAPGARVLKHDILSYRGAPAERVLLAFVLHEMAPDIRARALQAARENLVEGGLLGVLDFSSGAPFPVDPVFRAYLRVAEPELARGVLEGLPGELASAGFELRRRRPLCLSTAQMLVASC